MYPALEDLERNPRLKDIEIFIKQKDRIDLIIEMNARILHEIHDKRGAGPDQLCAGKSVLGWFLFGNDCNVDIEGAGIKHAYFLTSRPVDFSVGLG